MEIREERRTFSEKVKAKEVRASRGLRFDKKHFEGVALVSH